MDLTITPLRTPYIKFLNNHSKFILLFILFVGTFASAQTNFNEEAAAYNIDIPGIKDGGFSFSDFDLDGDLDLMVNTDQNNAFLLRRDGASYTDVTDQLTDGMDSDAERCAVWADLNNDGFPDFIRNTSFGPNGAGIEIRLQDPNTNIFGDGNGGTAPARFNGSNVSDGFNSEGLGVFDFDGDGDLDIFFDNHNFGIDLLINDGTGTFTHGTPEGPGYDQNDPSTWPFGLAQDAVDGDYGSATDYDNDGYVDIISRKRDQVDFFRNVDGFFTEAIEIDQANNNDKGAVALYDFDNDGDFDLFWTDNGDNAIYNNNNGIFEQLPTSVTGIPTDFGENIEGLACGDLDNDGDIDIFLAGSNYYIFFNQINDDTGAGTGATFNFQGGLAGPAAGNNGEGATMVDIEPDGDLDIYVNTNGGPNQLFTNQLEDFNNAQADNFLFFDIFEDRAAAGLAPGTRRYAHGATIRLVDCEGNVISGLREVNGGNGHGTQDTPRVHFGLPLDIDTEIIAEVFYPFLNGERVVVRSEVDPSMIGQVISVTTISPSVAPNNAPVAQDDEFTIDVEEEITFNVLNDNGNAADTDPDGDTITVDSFTPVSDGTLSQNPDGTFTYTPDPDFVGIATFDYTIVDNGSCQTLADSDTATVTITVVANPVIAIVKMGQFNDDSQADGFAQVGETITYTFTVTNPGDVSLGNITVNDPMVGNDPSGNILGPDSGDTDGDNRLDTNETWTFSIDYTLTQDDIDNGNVTNQATATGLPPDGDPVSDLSDESSPLEGEDDPTVTPVPQNPIIALVKDGVFNDLNNDTFAQEGETITYTFTVTNPGNVTIDTVVLTDDLINNGSAISGPDSGDTNDNDILEVTETWTYTATYTITQDDVDNGNVNNQALVTGQDPQDNPVEDDSDDDNPLEDEPTDTPLPNNPVIALVKTGVFNDVNGNGMADLADTITYTFTVTNEGDVTLTMLELTDSIVNDGNPIPEPNPNTGDTNDDGNLDLDETWVYTATYNLTQQNLNDSQVTNQALITSETPAGDPNNPNDDVTDMSDNDNVLENDVTITPLPGIAIVKTSVYNDTDGSGSATPNDIINYTFTVTNTGNTPLSNVTVTDPLINNGTAITGPDSGDNGDNILQTTETWVYTADYPITAQNIQDGNVVNQATATGEDENGTEVDDLSDNNSPLEDDETVTNFPGIAIIKTGVYNDANNNNQVDTADTIDYTFTVTNTGGTPLSDVTVTDPLINSGSPINGPDSGDNGDNILQTTETWVYSASYTLTQTNINNGVVENQATATGTDPDDNDVTDLSDDNSPLQDDMTETPIPSIAIVKTGAFANGNGTAVEAGDIINYTFTVTNPSNVSLSNVTVTDPLINSGAAITGPDSGDDGDDILQPTETWVYSATYAITAQNISDGFVENQATATGQDDNGNTVTDLSDDNSPLENEITNTPIPNIAIIKDGVYDDTNNNGMADIGDNINYTFTVTNQGESPLNDITVTDPLLNSGNPISGPDSGDTANIGVLDLSETWVYSFSYPITAANISDGFVNNQATATGTDDNDVEVSDLSDDDSVLENEMTTTLLPGIAIVKNGIYEDTDSDGAASIGDMVNYTFTVTNQGQSPLSDVTVTDPLIDSGNPIPGPDSGDTNSNDLLDLNETWVYSASYAITAQNITDQQVTNQATATGDDPDGTEVTDLSDDNSELENDMTITRFPGIAIVKTGAYEDTNTNGSADNGDSILYTFTVTNTGETPLQNIVVDDPLFAPDTVIPTPDPNTGDTNNDGNLDTDETWVYSATYALTPQNLTDGSVTNQATATGDDPDGNQVSDISDDNSPLENDMTVTPIPAIAIVKDGVYEDTNSNGMADIGDNINYTFTVTNQGESPLNDITVTDPLLNSGNPISGPDSGDTANIGVLDLSETWVYSFSYPITAANISDGFVNNQATATGTDDNDVEVSDLSDDDSVLENEMTTTLLPGIAIVKNGIYEDTDSDGAASIGDMVNYTFTVTNQGQSPLSDVTVTDPLIDSGNPIPGPDSGDTNSNDLLDLNETWVYSASYAITAQNITDQQVTNQATATGDDPDGTEVTDLSDDNSELENDMTITRFPGIAIVKTGAYEDTNTNGSADNGDSILYTFTVTNTGETPLQNIVVDDPLFAPDTVIPTPDPNTGDTNNDGNLDTDETWVYSATYALTPQNLTDGSVTNQATATGDDPDGNQVSDISDDNSPLENDMTVTPIPAIAIVKDGVYEDTNSNGMADIGDNINYTFTVTNQGESPLNDITVTDPLLNSGNPISGPDSGDTANIGVLDLNETWVYSFSYPITAANISDGFVNNQATATGTDDNDVEVSDLSDDDSVLENEMTTTLLPGIAIVKNGVYNDANNNNRADIGDTISYTFSVTNQGQSPLSGVTVTDPLIDSGNPIPGPDSGDNGDNILQTTETWIYTATYAITAQNITEGNVSNQATATGNDPDGTEVTDLSDDNSVLENDNTNTLLPNIAIVKTGNYEDTNTSNTADIGDNINYEFTVTNQGQLPLMNVTVTDPLINSGAPISGPDSGDTNNDDILDLDEVWVYTATYPITQANINDGNVINQATATGVDENNNTAEDISDDNSPLENDPTDTPLEQTPSIGLVKDGVYNDTNGNNTADIGDTITYTFTVTNEGNTTLDNLELTDPIIDGGNPIPGPDSGDTGNDGVLDLDEVWIYTATYTLTPTNISELSVSNQALVTSDDPDDNNVEDDSDDNSPLEDDTTITPLPAIAIVKTGTYNDANNNNTADLGDTINYMFTVTNEGNSPLENISVDDPLFAPNTEINGPDSGDTNGNNLLDLDETWIYTATYALTAQNITDGTITNQATATGSDPDGTDVTDLSDDDSTVENEPTVTLLPAIAIVKTGAYEDTDGSNNVSVGDSINYTFIVTNSGETPLENIIVDDPLFAPNTVIPTPNPNTGDTNNDGNLDTDETWVYNATYSITAQNIADGNVMNQATATGEDENGTEVTDLSDDNSPLEDDPTVTPFPGIAIVKMGVYEDTNTNMIVDVADMINYTFLVTNTGNTPLNNVNVTDPLIDSGNAIPGPDSGDTNNDNILNIDETWVYTASYQITQANIDDRNVMNQATATGEDQNNNTVTDLSDDDSPLENEMTNTPLPGIAIVKTGVYEDSNANNTVDLGDSILYTFTVTNTGNTPLENVVVNDPLFAPDTIITGPDSGDSNSDGILDTNETWVYSATYPITQDNIDDRSVTNQATATGEDQNGTPTMDDSDDESPLEDNPTVTPIPGIAIVKDGTYNDSSVPIGMVNAGDMIDYTFTVTNTGNVPLSNIIVTDPLINAGGAIPGPDSGDANGDDILDLDETWTYTASYTITDANITDGFVMNQATATGQDPDGMQTSDMSDDDSPLEDEPTVTELPGIAIVKTGLYNDTDGVDGVSVGDLITYTFTVTNTGQQPLMDVTVTDPLIESGNPIPGPDSGDANGDGILDLDETWVYTATYPITQDNINDGNVSNQATATGTDENGNMDSDLSDDDSPLEDDPTDTPLDQVPAIAIVKTGVYNDSSVPIGMVNAGDMIDYTFTVTNTGNVPLSNIIVTDPLINAGGAIPGPDSGDANGDDILDLDETWTYTASYTITDANITDGFVMNQATATGQDPDGMQTSDMSDDDSPLEDEPTVTELPGIAIVKTGLYNDTDGVDGVSVGDLITYTFTVTNTGQQPLMDVTVTDPLIDSGNPIPGPDSGDDNGDNVLDLDETWVYTATYPITQDNINDGNVTNQATATGTDENGNMDSDLSDDDSPLEDDPTDTPLDQVPTIAIVKTGVYNDSSAPTGSVNAGDMIDYTFTVTNTGNVPLANVVVDDPLFAPDTVIAGPDSGDTDSDGILDIDETWTYTASYTITDANITDGFVMNQATATGEDPDGMEASDMSDDDSPLEDEPTVTELPGIAIVKTGLYNDTDGVDGVSVGDLITYTFTVTNTGQQPLMDVTVTDPLIDSGNPIPGPDSGDDNGDNVLDLDETWVYTATYPITQDNINDGNVTNQATATGTDENGNMDSDLSDDDSPLEDDPTDTPLDQVPTIAIVKTGVYNDSSAPTGSVNAGDMIDYTFTVTNTGNVPLANVVVDDPLFAPDTVIAGPDSGDTDSDGILDIDETWTYTASYTITDANITDGFVMNQATATGEDPDGMEASDMSDDDSPLEDEPTVTELPGIAIVKTGLYNDTDGVDGVSVGDLITYTFTVTNTGQQPLMDVTVTDPLIDSGNPIPGPDSGDDNGDNVLDLDETWVYTATYPITQDNINDGNVTNQATATGTDENGNMDSDLSDDDSPLEDDPTDTPLDQVPTIAIVKTGVYNDSSAPTGSVNAGDMIDYTFTVTNTGNVPLANVVVDDPLFAPDTVIAGPDSGDTDSDDILDIDETWTYTASYTITDANITDGFVMNQATATGEDPDGMEASDMSDDDSPLEDEPTVTELPGIALVKDGAYQDRDGSESVTLGDVIVYTFTVTNTGQQPLSDISIVDPKINNGNPIIGAPDSGDFNDDLVLDLDEIWIYTAEYEIQQGEIDSGFVNNQATVTGNNEDGTPTTDDSDDDSPLEDDETVTPLPSIGLLKVGAYEDTDDSGDVTVGDNVNYMFTVINNGNTPLTNVVLTDPLINNGNPIPGPDSGDVNGDNILDVDEIWTYTAVYAITADDIANNRVTNLATVTGNDPDDNPISDDSDDEDPLINEPTETLFPGIAIVKDGMFEDTDSSGDASVGDMINYTFTVTNTGETPLSDVTVTDDLITNGSITFTGGDDNDNNLLDTDETWSFTATYAITAEDIVNEGVTNQALATGTDPNGVDVTDLSDDDSPLDDDPTETLFPGIAIVKDGMFEDTDGSGDASVGDMINYTFTVTNTGETPLSDVTVTDDLITNGSITFTGGDDNDNNLLDTDETWTFTATYAITTEDIVNEGVTNQALATGTDPNGVDVTDLSDDDSPLDDDPTETLFPGIAIVKDGMFEDTDGSGDASVGDMINYTFTVTNTGETPLSDVTVTDDLITDGSITFTGGDDNDNNLLDTDETWTFTATYAITAEDITNGSVTNQALATGTDPDGVDVTDLSDDDSPLDDDPTETLLPGIAIVKVGQYSDTDGNTGVTAGDLINYTFTVTNTGEVPLSNVTVTDPLITNNSITFVDGDANGNGLLDIDETWTFTATYEITAEDITNRMVINQAIATGEDEDGTPVSDDSDDESPLDDGETITPIPNIAIVKVGEYADTDGSGNANPGDLINYTFTVTNTGATPLANVTITDELITNGSINFVDGDTNGDDLLDLDETWIYTATYVITAEDITNGSVTNQAIVTGEDEDGTPVSDESDDDSPLEDDPTVTEIPAPAIALVKTSVVNDPNDDGFAQVGETITYTFSVSNVGNVPLSDIRVVDLLISPNPIDGPVSGDTNNDNILDLDEIWVYEATYTITQDDIDMEIVINTATATGTPPEGDDVSDISDDNSPVEDDPTETPIRPNGEIAIVKTSTLEDPDNDGIAQVGDIITYEFIVTNVGNVILDNVELTDNLLEDIGITPEFIGGDDNNDERLDFDETWLYTAQYPISQADLDAGQVINQAVATAVTPVGDVVNDDSDDNSPIEDDPTITVFESPPCELTRQALKDGISKVVTPNQDGENDVFSIPNSPNCNYEYGVIIVNRLGNKVFEQRQNYQNNWDGFSQNSFIGGDQLPAGTYYYVVEVTNANIEPITGFIYLGTK